MNRSSIKIFRCLWKGLFRAKSVAVKCHCLMKGLLRASSAGIRCVGSAIITVNVKKLVFARILKFAHRRHSSKA